MVSLRPVIEDYINACLNVVSVWNATVLKVVELCRDLIMNVEHRRRMLEVTLLFEKKEKNRKNKYVLC